VVNPRTDRTESAAEIRIAIGGALEIVPSNRLFLNPDCGFGTFSRRPVNSRDGATSKLRALVRVANEVRLELERS
jgi:5-methyltetrahydropteroyltriglutamate--homocysteine methyltransferase